MKKKHILIASIGLIAVSLSSCQYFMQFTGGNGSGGVYFFPGLNSNNGAHSIVDVSTPPAGEITANTSLYTYKDYAKNNAYALSVTPSTGDANLLVIPVWFTDSNNFIATGKKESVRQDIEKAYFGSNEDVGWRSVKTYYEEESLNTLTLTGKVSAWYECDKSYTYYAKDPTRENQTSPNTTALVEEVTNWYFENNPKDYRRNYDHDGDGYLDGVIVIYAAPDLQTIKRDDYDNLWAYCFWIQKTDSSHKNAANPGVNAFFWASYDYMYGDDVANARTGAKYGAGDTKHCNIDTHTYIHEMGHMFGLEDYYDYSSFKYQPAGGFSMQDHNVGGHDPFSSFALGWGKAYVPTDSINIDLKPFSTSGEMILLKPNHSGVKASPFDEYILLEYYTPLGLNTFDTDYQYMKSYGKNYPNATKDYGIRVWHVDARLTYRNVLDPNWNPANMTNDPTTSSGRVTLAMSNSYDDGRCSYISVLGSQYANFNLLQLIRNSMTSTYKPGEKEYFVSGALFKANDIFTMGRYGKQFVNEGKLNSNIDLGFSFSVNACNNEYASISIIKV